MLALRNEGRAIVEDFIGDPVNKHGLFDPLQSADRYVRIQEYICSISKELSIVIKDKNRILYHNGRIVAKDMIYENVTVLIDMLGEHRKILENLWIVLGGEGFHMNEHTPLDVQNCIIEYSDLNINNFRSVLAASTVSAMGFAHSCNAGNIVFKWENANEIYDKIIPIFKSIVESGNFEKLESLGAKIHRVVFYVSDNVRSSELYFCLTELMDLFAVNRRAAYPDIKPLFLRASAVHVIVQACIMMNDGDTTWNYDVQHYHALVQQLVSHWNHGVTQGTIFKELKINKIYIETSIRKRNGQIKINKDSQLIEYALPPLHDAPQFGNI